MPINNPIVGEIYNVSPTTSDQWMYVYETKGPYVYMSGIVNTHLHTKMRRSVLKQVANSHNYGSNGLRLFDGGILGLSDGTSQRAEGVLFLQGEDE
jgi:hypothetical protein